MISKERIKELRAEAEADNDGTILAILDNLDAAERRAEDAESELLAEEALSRVQHDRADRAERERDTALAELESLRAENKDLKKRLA